MLELRILNYDSFLFLEKIHFSISWKHAIISAKVKQKCYVDLDDVIIEVSNENSLDQANCRQYAEVSTYKQKIKLETNKDNKFQEHIS